MMWCVNLLISLYATLSNMLVITSKIIHIGTNKKYIITLNIFRQYFRQYLHFIRTIQLIMFFLVKFKSIYLINKTKFIVVL